MHESVFRRKKSQDTKIIIRLLAKGHCKRGGDLDKKEQCKVVKAFLSLHAYYSLYDSTAS